MKTAPENKKKLRTIKKALRRGIPLPGAEIGADADRGPEEEIPLLPIDVGSVSFPLAGVAVPPRLKEILVKSYEVRSGDTWEKLAKRYKTTVKSMLRLNGVPPRKVSATVMIETLPEDLKLVPGRRIHVPAPGQKLSGILSGRMLIFVEQEGAPASSPEDQGPSPESPGRPKK